MATNLTIPKTDYEAIVAVYETLKNSTLATNTTIVPLLETLKAILLATDSTNTLTRHYLCVRWYDLSARPADHADYPPQEESTFHSYTAFTKGFVESFVASQTSNYANILVTDDPSGNVGWLALDTFFS